MTSDDWCRKIEDKLTDMDRRLAAIEDYQRSIIKVVVLGLLAIVGTVAGVNVLG